MIAARSAPEAQRPEENRPIRPRHDDPFVPDEITAADLNGGARNELKTLSKENAEWVARHLAMPVEDLRAIYSQLSTVNVAALDELLGGGDDRPGGVSLGDTLGDDRTLDPASSMEAAETKFLLARAIECLGERERIVVVLYYYEGMTLAEIGRVLGVTESRISQMHTAAMVRLRTRLLEAERV